MRTKPILLAAVAATCLLDAGAALAQSTDDIVVVARKREELIMKVPVVLNVIDGKQIERYELSDLRRVADQVPGLIIGEGQAAANGTQVSLRGVGTSVTNNTIDQSVSLNVDGQQFTQGLAYTAALFDIQQFTVLKGPQALFFGKASPGGVIAVNTANPTPDFMVSAKVGCEFEARSRQAELVLSGPISPTLGFRLAGRFNKRDGYFRNKAVAIPALGALPQQFNRGPRDKTVLFRGTLLWEPTDNFSARLKITHSDANQDGKVQQLVSCPDGTAGPAGIPFIGATPCRQDRDFVNVDLDPAAFRGILRGGRQYADIRQDFGVLELNYGVTDDIKVTSVTGYYDMHEDDQFNGTYSGASGPALSASTHYTIKDFTQEIRVSSDFRDLPVNFTVGGFYQKTKQFKIGIALGNTVIRLPAFLSNGTHSNPQHSESLFGQLLWKIAPTIELAGGARWTHEERRHIYTNLLVSPTPVALKTTKLSSNRVSPEATLTFTPSDNLTIFGALKKGYKSGGFNSSGSFRTGADSSYGDEKVEGGEVGLKARLADRRLSLNLSAYYYKYGGLQVTGSTRTDEGIITARTLNAASSKVRGIELDTSYRPDAFDGLTLRAAANWNRASYGTFNNAPCYEGQMISEGCTQVFSPSANQTTPPVGSVRVAGVAGFFTAQDLSGRQLLRAPEFSATAGFDYERSIGNLKLILASQLRYSSSYYADAIGITGFKQGAFTKLNASVGLVGPDDKWELSLIANNITDKLVQNRCSAGNSANGSVLGGMITGGVGRGIAGQSEITCNIDAGREIWVRASVKF